MSSPALHALPDAAARRSVRRNYRDFLAEPPDLTGTAEGMTVRLRWLPGSPPPLPDALDALREAEITPHRVLKQSHINRLVHADLFGQEVVIKSFTLAKPSQRLRYRWRASRGRRSFAAARTLQQLGIPTPAPLGWVEWTHYGVPQRSLYLAAWLADAPPARRWIKARLHRAPPAARDAFRRTLLEALMSLYGNGIYHADTKTSNLLLTDAEDPERRRLHWIDLDCLHFGVRPSRRQVLRNLVQLNGSLGAKLPDADRLAFLEDLAEVFPWLRDPGIPDQLRARTLERLTRELTGVCGP